MTASREVSAYRSLWTDLHRTSFTQAWVNAGGIQTRYANAGPPGAPAVIMVHGTAGSWESFAGNLGPLAERFNCFALDMIGCGFTDKPDFDYEIPVYVQHLRDFMRAVGVERASLIGVSMGSWISAAFAQAHPQATEKLILMAAAGLVAREEVATRVTRQRQAASEVPDWEGVRAIFNNLILDESNRIDDLVAIRLSAYRQTGAQQAMRHVLALLEMEAWRRNLLPESVWRGIVAPTLLIAAIDRPDTYLEDARALAKLLPNVRLVEMQRVCHWPQFEDPATFNRIAIDFLQGSSRA